jgi:uncharacterized membrane protein YtjA (UPF0391 family)
VAVPVKTSQRFETALLFSAICGWKANCIRGGGRRKKTMLGWVWMFLVLALIAAIFGFTGVGAAAAGIAKILFFIFLVVFVIGLLMGRRVVG